MERFTIPKLEERVAEVGATVYSSRVTVSPVRWVAGWPEGSERPDYDDGEWEALLPGFLWGGRDTKITLRCRFQVPGQWRGEHAAVRVDLSRGLHVSGPDATAYIDGKAVQGVDVNHCEVLLEPEHLTGSHVLSVQAYSGTRPERHEFGGVSLVLIDAATRDFYHDARVALEVAKVLDEGSYEKAQIVNALDEAFRLVDFREPLGEEYRRSIGQARQVLRERVYDQQWPGERPKVIGVGHAHIDVAWLWTLLHTRKKTERTFVTVLRLMEQYPDYCFLQSQPQLYAYFREEHPERYEEIKRRIAEGRWEATGAMWVEADINITGGESLVRQILMGKRFFRKELGVDPKLLWLPDVFGYTWSLPQLKARSGLKYYMTTKISWNEFNQFPHDTFRWQGIDGTQIVTHFINTPSQSWFATYNGRLTPAEVLGSWRAYKQKRLNSELLLAFGFGDGGGGPSAEMLETARRLRDLPGMPRFEIGSAERFFRDLEPKAPAMPVWNGELYLELHRGTYTSQAQNKRLNRKAEGLYHSAEALASMAHLVGGEYPASQLGQGWKLILLNQFHDILPGSSIREVYEESAEQYAKVLEIGEAAQAAAVRHLCSQIDTERDSLVVFNTLGWNRGGLVEIDAREDSLLRLVDEAGRAVVAQVVGEDGGGRRALVRVEDVPAYGWKTLRVGQGSSQPAGPGLKAEPGLLECPFFRVSFDGAGRITSLLDRRAGREVIASGGLGDEFVLFEDKPIRFDAWDINIFYQEKSWVLGEPASVRVVEEGPLRAGLEFFREFRQSTLKQKVYVYADLPRIDFETEVDWHEKHLLLKVAFPVAVHCHRATYEIQFGSIERPTHWNTSWDWARFEVPAQRWADLSEGDYGVSLLNDCKYGYDIRDNVMRLTLIKSATSPDPEADQGRHVFCYSLYPHQGDWRYGTVQQAAELNLPLLGVLEAGHGGSLPRAWSLVSADSPNIIVDTVKKAEDDGNLIVRAYEAYGQRGRATLSFGRPLRDACECNLLEEEESAVSFEGSELAFSYTPYQVRTFKVQLA